jgi:transposase-like protein
MFSYEDRLRAVQLYIKLGRRIGLTIRQLGYPTKNALKSWHREYEQRLDLPAGYVRQPRYPQARKERAVRHYLEHGRCIAATIRALGYPSRSLLSEWLQELNPQERTGIVGRSRELTPAAKQTAVIALCMRPASAQVVAEELGVSRCSLYSKRAGNTSREVEADQREAPGCQRCGSNSSICPAGCVGSRVSTSLM